MALAPDERVEIDTSRLPLLFIRLPQRATIEGVNVWHDELEAVLRQATRKIAFIIDLRDLDVRTMTAAHRRAVAARTQRLIDLGLTRRIGADVRIAHNSIIAGAIKAVGWLTGDVSWPQGTFTTEEDAIAFANAQLAKQG